MSFRYPEGNPDGFGFIYEPDGIRMWVGKFKTRSLTEDELIDVLATVAQFRKMRYS